MNKLILLAVLVGGLLAATACGTSTSAQPAPTSDAVTPASSGGANQITITLADNTITASQTTFQAGVPYTFVITNTGNHTHNFNISTPVSVAGSLSASQASALLSVPEEKLRPGAVVTAQYTFLDSAVGTKLEFSCLIQRHYEDGMRLPITVTK